MVITIYCLYNPVNSEIRYIGRTKSPLKRRLQQHLCKARNNYSNSYKENWIRKLLKNGITPRIKKLTVLHCSWEDSHRFEKNLIEKHLLKHNLVNGDDRGPGKLSKNTDPTVESIRISKLKEHFNKEENKINFYNKVYCYDINGKYMRTYVSSKHVVEDLNINYNTLLNHKNRADKLKVNPINGFYFRDYKADKIEIYDKSVIKVTDIKSKKEVIFYTIKEFSSYFNLSHWDLHQMRKGIKTQRLKELEVSFKISPLQ